MTIFTYILMAFLVICAIGCSLSRSLLNSVLIFMSYSLIMSIIWVILQAPDLAITEAAVGAGVTTILFLLTLKKIRGVVRTREERAREEEEVLEEAEAEADALLKAQEEAELKL